MIRQAINAGGREWHRKEQELGACDSKGVISIIKEASGNRNDRVPGGVYWIVGAARGFKPVKELFWLELSVRAG